MDGTLNPWSRSIELGLGPAGRAFIDAARRFHYATSAPWPRRCWTLSIGCAYCGAEATTLDHVVPKARGGRNAEENLWPCCQSCNLAKGSTPLLVWLANEAERRHRRTLMAHNARQSREVKTSLAAKLREAFEAERIIDRRTRERPVGR